VRAQQPAKQVDDKRMTPGQASGGIDPAGSASTATPPRTPLLRRRSFRAAILSAAAILAIIGTLVIAYELALARVPEHRAALERLIRAQTGLDVRFNELGLRWGWYGPEAVFRRVELGEPGRSNVLLRAPQLVVSFDAWRTMQTGQLAAGRITLIAPDIDLERLAHGERPSPAAIPERAAADTSLAGRMRVLERWRGGRIDLQGGTLRLPDPNGSTNPITVQVRRASLRHTDDEWSGFGLVYLPERLGRAARIVVQFQGDIGEPRTLSGGVRFEGMRLAFAGWREVFRDQPWLARSLPASGAGDITLQLTLKDGRVEKANGGVKANDVVFGTPVWVDPARAGSLPHGVLSLDYLSGDWRFASRSGGGQVQLEQLVLSREDKDQPLPPIAIEFGAGHVHGSVERAPLHAAAAIARWLAPRLVPAGVVLTGTADSIDFDWNTARVEGERLAASARVEDAGVEATSGGFAVSGLQTRLTGSESRVAIELAAPAAQITLASLPERPFEAVKLTSVLEITRSETGWRMATEHLSVAHDSGRLTLSGVLSGTDDGDVPTIEARGAIPHADVAKLHALLADSTSPLLGPVAARLTAGRIEDAKFELNGRLDEVFAALTPREPSDTSGRGASAAASANADAFKGSLTLLDARLEPEGAWPATRAVRASLEWAGPQVRASIDEGRAGAFELLGVEAEWDISGAREAHVTGHARARLEHALAWLRAHPELQEQAPHLQDLVARGDTLFDFDVSVPAQTALPPRGTPPKTHARIAAMLEGVQLRLATALPPLEALRGSLAFDSGRLQKSTLSATWLDSPLTLKVGERRDRRGSVIAVQAQGYVDARKLVALSQLRDLPEVSGETQWSGEFLYTAASDVQPVRWQGHADTSLIGIASDLPAPFGKLADATVPLHVEIAGTVDASEVRANLAERVRSAFALKLQGDDNWQIERGAIRMGGGTAALPADKLIAIDGHLKRLDLPAYLLAWQQLGKLADTTPATVNLSADELSVGNRVHTNATLQAEPVAGGTAMRVESESLGLLTGTLAAGVPQIMFKDVKWTRETLSGEGSLQCAASLATCNAKFEISTDSAARALVDLGFRPDIAATQGALSGQLTWQPHADWLETASGHINMRFDDGIVRSSVTASGHPFPLLTVPALLSGIARPPSPEPTMSSGELRFKRLDAEFELRNGQAYTSDLHFDGDAEILMRGRTGLLAHDYDHEAWVLRGEERIPASLRRLAATPRVAAAWMALRELLGAEGTSRSHVVLHLRGSWSEPVVTGE
jgi:uncharacterized protein YhdP